MTDSGMIRRVRLQDGFVDLVGFFDGCNDQVVPAGEGRYTMWGGNAHRFLDKTGEVRFQSTELGFVEVTEKHVEPKVALAMLPEGYYFTSLPTMLVRIACLIESNHLERHHLNHFYEADENGKVKWETVVWYAGPAGRNDKLKSGWIVRRTHYVNFGTYGRGDLLWMAEVPEEEAKTAA